MVLNFNFLSVYCYLVFICHPHFDNANTNWMIGQTAFAYSLITYAFHITQITHFTIVVRCIFIMNFFSSFSATSSSNWKFHGFLTIELVELISNVCSPDILLLPILRPPSIVLSLNGPGFAVSYILFGYHFLLFPHSSHNFVNWNFINPWHVILLSQFCLWFY